MRSRPAHIRVTRRRYEVLLAPLLALVTLCGSTALGQIVYGDEIFITGDWRNGPGTTTNCEWDNLVLRDDAGVEYTIGFDVTPTTPSGTYGAMAMIFNEEYERAVTWCDEALVLPNRQYWTLAHKLVALAFLGHTDEADSVKAKLLREKPDFSVSFTKEKLFYIKRQDQLDRYLEGLEKAGISNE